MGLAAGERFLMEFSTFEDRYLCMVTEVEEGGDLRVHAPIPPTVADRLASDRRVFVRFALEGRLHGFESEVLHDDATPGSALLIAGPQEVKDVEERREPRCQFHFPANVVCEDRASSAVVEDMSASCSRVRLLSVSSETLLGDEHTMVRLTFHPFDPQEGYSVECSVMRTFMREGSHCMVLEYAEDGAVRNVIERFVNAQSAIGGKRLSPLPW